MPLDRGLRKSLWQGASFFTSVVSRCFKHQVGDSTFWHGSILNFEREKPRVQRPPTFLSFPPTAREDLQLDEYLECLRAAQALHILRTHIPSPGFKHRSYGSVTNFYTVWAVN
ncbi:hypothetical protein TNCV_2940671 [Trichonephila clavipes]|nr:hypothetical protein TNCV_2940671 [Trichonephila clavipes]